LTGEIFFTWGYTYDVVVVSGRGMQSAHARLPGRQRGHRPLQQTLIVLVNRADLHKI